MATWYWSADTLFWQVSVDYNMDVQYQTKATYLCQPIIWSMAAMLHDSTVAAVVCTRLRATPLAMITMRNSTHGFPFVSHIWDAYGLRLAALGAAQELHYDQLTPVKTRYLLTSITWPYRGLKSTTDRDNLVLSIRSDEGLTLETSAFESLYGG